MGQEVKRESVESVGNIPLPPIFFAVIGIYDCSKLKLNMSAKFAQAAVSMTTTCITNCT